MGEVTLRNLNGVWRMCPQFINDFEGFDEPQEDIKKHVVALGKNLDLEMDEEDVSELLESHGKELSVEELVEWQAELDKEEEPVQEKKFTLKGLSHFFTGVEEVLAEVEAMDSDTPRFQKVSREVMSALTCYRLILEEKQKAAVQPSVLSFFKKVEKPAPSSSRPVSPQPSTSRALSPQPSTSRAPPSPTLDDEWGVDSPAPLSASSSPPSSPQ